MKASTAAVFAGVAVVAAALGVYFATWQTQSKLPFARAAVAKPMPELSGYRTPVEGLWLGGPAMHPGIAGLCGFNCARQIMRAT